MKCLVINLDRSVQRLLHVRQAFARLNLDFERVGAIDGASLPEETVAQLNARNEWLRALTKAEAGCLLSHRKCWEAVAAGEAPYAAVFEDDMQISESAQPLLRSSDWIPQGVDFVKLETRKRAVVVGWAARRISPDHRLTRLFSFHDGLGGYILSKSSARWLCSQIPERTAPVDQLVLNPQFGIFQRLNVFQLTPAICIPQQLARGMDDRLDAMPSTIDPDGNLYVSDQSLQQRSRPTTSAVQRELARMTASLQRAATGRKRVRIPYR
ncbi:MAG TPA: glycosyltransferase family 25 protein [Povalibacter sp.]|nr:glycosyltransferase family 25 protein [Povalibacter sp.]